MIGEHSVKAWMRRYKIFFKGFKCEEVEKSHLLNAVFPDVKLLVSNQKTFYEMLPEQLIYLSDWLKYCKSQLSQIVGFNVHPW